MLAACASEPDEGGANADGNAGDGTEAAGKEGGDLIIAVGADAISLDPHIANDVSSGNVNINIYETLTKFNEDIELEPLLAESWEEIDDNVWEFKLKEGITFQDGSEFNAEVVKMNRAYFG